MGHLDNNLKAGTVEEWKKLLKNPKLPPVLNVVAYN